MNAFRSDGSVQLVIAAVKARVPLAVAMLCTIVAFFAGRYIYRLWSAWEDRCAQPAALTVRYADRQGTLATYDAFSTAREELLRLRHNPKYEKWFTRRREEYRLELRRHQYLFLMCRSVLFLVFLIAAASPLPTSSLEINAEQRILLPALMFACGAAILFSSSSAAYTAVVSFLLLCFWLHAFGEPQLWHSPPLGTFNYQLLTVFAVVFVRVLL